MSDLQPTPDFSALAALIESRRGRVARLVNRELGAHINRRIAVDGWGRGKIAQFASYLSTRMPSVHGFSSSNLWRMRKFFVTRNPQSGELATLSRVSLVDLHTYFRDNYIFELESPA